MGFKELMGQNLLKSSLRSMIKSGRITHAHLLEGPVGSGKKSWGMAMAKAILCLDRIEGDSCGSCASCRMFQSERHPGLFIVKPEKQKIKIDQLRSLQGMFYLAGDDKVCLVERAETMTAEAASSLLKILEEPPGGLYFILLVEQRRFLFDTILSRCRCYKLQPLGKEEIRDLLIQEKDLDPAKADTLVAIAGGYAGYALELAEDESMDKRLSEVLSLADGLLSGNWSAHSLLLKADELSGRDDLVLLLTLLAAIFRDCLVKTAGSGEKMILQHAARSMGHVFPAGPDLEKKVRLINTVINEMNATNVNRRLLLEKMLILLQRR